MEWVSEPIGTPARREDYGSDPDQTEKTNRVERRELVDEIEIEIAAETTVEIEIEIVESKTESRQKSFETESVRFEIAALERLALQQRLQRREQPGGRRPRRRRRCRR